MQLSEHFADTELGVCGCDDRILRSAQALCEKILEPIRVKFGPVRVHDGYRDPGHNARVGGKPTSWHQFNDTRAAADFDCLPTPFQQVFNWIRLESGLPFDKVILEHGPSGSPAAVHIQFDPNNPPRRLAYTGSTGDGSVYTPQTVV